MSVIVQHSTGKFGSMYLNPNGKRRNESEGQVTVYNAIHDCATKGLPVNPICILQRCQVERHFTKFSTTGERNSTLIHLWTYSENN